MFLTHVCKHRSDSYGMLHGSCACLDSCNEVGREGGGRVSRVYDFFGCLYGRLSFFVQDLQTPNGFRANSAFFFLFSCQSIHALRDAKTRRRCNLLQAEPILISFFLFSCRSRTFETARICLLLLPRALYFTLPNEHRRVSRRHSPCGTLHCECSSRYSRTAETQCAGPVRGKHRFEAPHPLRGRGILL